MTIDQAIQKAVEYGWITDGSCALKGTWIARHEQMRAILDPLFWQALGKSMDWEKEEYHENDGIEVMAVGRHECNNKCISRMNYYGFEWKGQVWLFQWHRMIDHLAEGGTIESFFKKL